MKNSGTKSLRSQENESVFRVYCILRHEQYFTVHESKMTCGWSDMGWAGGRSKHMQRLAALRHMVERGCGQLVHVKPMTSTVDGTRRSTGPCSKCLPGSNVGSIQGKSNKVRQPQTKRPNIERNAMAGLRIIRHVRPLCQLQI